MKTGFAEIHLPADTMPPFQTKIPAVWQPTVTAGAVYAEAVLDSLGRVDLATEVAAGEVRYAEMVEAVMSQDEAVLFRAAFLAGLLGRIQQTMLHAGIGAMLH